MMEVLHRPASGMILGHRSRWPLLPSVAQLLLLLCLTHHLDRASGQLDLPPLRDELNNRYNEPTVSRRPPSQGRFDDSSNIGGGRLVRPLGDSDRGRYASLDDSLDSGRQRRPLDAYDVDDSARSLGLGLNGGRYEEGVVVVGSGGNGAVRRPQLQQQDRDYPRYDDGRSIVSTTSSTSTRSPFDRDREEEERQRYLQQQQQQPGFGRRPPPSIDYGKLLASLAFVGTQQCSNNVAAQWNYETNVNELTQLQALQAQRQYADFQFHAWQQISQIDPNTVRDPTTRRRLRYLSAVGPAALPPDQLDRYNRLINDMLSIYNSATICAYKDPLRCGFRLYPEISEIMAHSRDWDELQWVWLEWRRRSGSQMKDYYRQLVDLNNEAAHMNNFTNAAEYWQFPYESFDFEREVDEVWEEIKPLYDELHAYVRRKLRDLYGPEKISRQAPLPSHILGNIWAQSWTNILDLTLPYPGKNYLDATVEMQAQGYTPIDLFRVGEDFFLSLNLSALPPEFWAGSLIVDPGDRPLICQASAWDFCNGIDYRIKMCTKVTMKDLITVHHEMAHIQYFLRYNHLPREFRDGANPGFHEAIGEAVALSVATPKHLQTLGLANKYVDERAADINYLFALAMEKLILLPYSIALDKWRWDVFRGEVHREEYNCHWHRMKERYTGTKPPVLRSEDDFDPGSKYHIPANIPYIRY